MTQPAEPAARALQRVRKRHAAGQDGKCVEDQQPWPCATIQDADGPDQGNDVAAAVNKLATLTAVWAQQPPTNLQELRRLAREAVGPPEPPAPQPPAGTAPTGGSNGDAGGQPPVDQVQDQR